jgi:glutamine amidotransferase
MSNIAIIDYGSSNLRSVFKALEKGAARRQKVEVTNDPKVIAAADRVVFPGQGAIDNCMSQMEELDLIETVKEVITEKPFLGICLGLQSLMISSEENDTTQCLGIYDGIVKRFNHQEINGKSSTPREKIPHMGWNQVQWTKPHPLTADIPTNSHFYFVHSYFVEVQDKTLIASQTEHIHDFTSAIAKNNVFATQFHPEKSAALGLTLLRNFVTWDGNC